MNLNNLKTSVSGYRVYNVGKGVSILRYDCKIGDKIYHNTILRTTKKFDSRIKAKIIQCCNHRGK